MATFPYSITVSLDQRAFNDYNFAGASLKLMSCATSGGTFVDDVTLDIANSDIGQWTGDIDTTHIEYYFQLWYYYTTLAVWTQIGETYKLNKGAYLSLTGGSITGNVSVSGYIDPVTLKINGTAVTATATELNTSVHGATFTSAEANLLLTGNSTTQAELAKLHSSSFTASDLEKAVNDKLGKNTTTLTTTGTLSEDGGNYYINIATSGKTVYFPVMSGTSSIGTTWFLFFGDSDSNDVAINCGSRQVFSQDAVSGTNLIVEKIATAVTYNNTEGYLMATYFGGDTIYLHAMYQITIA